MNTLIGTGFIVLTIVFFWLLLRVLRSALDKSSWDEGKKKSVYRGTLLGLAG